MIWQGSEALEIKTKQKRKKNSDQISIRHNNRIIQHLIWLLIIGCAVIEMEIIYSGHSVLLLNHLCAMKGFANCQRFPNCILPRSSPTPSLVLFHILSIFLECELYHPCSSSARPTFPERSPSRDTEI